MSSSSDAAASYLRADRPDLRSGEWTRLGDRRVLGDEATEAALGALARRARSAARAQGYAVGWAEGRQEALTHAARTADLAEEQRRRDEVHRAEQHEAAIAGLVRAAGALEATTAAVSARVAEQATDLALAVTRVIVGHELAVAADPGAQVVARVLAALPDDPTVQVRLHPEAAGSSATRLLEQHGVRMIADPDLGLHDAVVETDTGVIDLRIGAALDRLAEVLHP